MLYPTYGISRFLRLHTLLFRDFLAAAKKYPKIQVQRNPKSDSEDKIFAGSEAGSIIKQQATQQATHCLV
jgi:hypothetical protein